MLIPTTNFMCMLLSVSVSSLPFYKIKVNVEDKKVLDITSDNKDYNEQNENEMIQSADLTNLKSYIEDESRYKPLHSYVDSYNKREIINKMQHTNTFFHFKPRIWESSIIENDDIPVIAGFKNELNNVISNKSRKIKTQKLFKKVLRNNSFYRKISDGTINTNEDLKRSIFSNNISDDDSTEAGEEIYDYYEFKREYDEQIVQGISTNKPINYTSDEDTTEQQKEVLQELLDFENCTETSTKFGIKALDCLVYKYEQHKDNPIIKKTLSKVWLIMKIWFLIYVSFAIPCWCHKGWCCCCFRCKFCFPRKRILFAKQYYISNPPGVLSMQAMKKEEKRDITYEPTEFEEDAYENFEAAIRNI